MDVSFSQVLAVLAVLLGTALTVLVEKVRKENSKDHASVNNRLGEIHNDIKDVRTDVRNVNERLTDHIEWHAERKK